MINFKRSLSFIKRLNELWLGPIALVIWFVSTPILHKIDATAATYDNAVFQKLVFGLVVFSLCHFSVWLMIRLTFPGLFKYLTEEWDNDFVKLTEDKKWEKLKISFAVFACYLFALLLSMLVL